jgi:transcriptional regulator with XRE-family HTH domain
VKPKSNPFSKVIREARRNSGLTQLELASLCDISDVYISQIENGHRIPSSQISVALANALQLDPKELVRLAQGLKEPVMAEYFPTSEDGNPLWVTVHPSIYVLLNSLEEAKLSEERLLTLVEAWSRILELVKSETRN